MDGRWWVGVVALLLSGALVWTPASHAQAVLEDGPHIACELPVHGPAHGAPGHVHVGPGQAVRETGCAPGDVRAAFEVTYTGFPPQAQAAVAAAVDAWACRLGSPVPVRIDARWVSLGGQTLGSAGPYRVRDFAGAPVPGTFYPIALANALVGRDLSPQQPHVQADFNSAFARWHFDTGVPPPATLFDLYTVALHELGHGLGLIGGLTVEGGRGFVGGADAAPIPNIYDRLTTDAAGRPLVGPAYPNGSPELADVLQSAVFLAGRAVRATRGGPLPLFAPRPWSPGGSLSHFDEAAFPAGTPDGLMTPFIAAGELINTPGAQTCAALADLGWALAGPCAALASVPPPLADGARVERRGANPFRTETALGLAVEVPQTVRVWLYDARGARVATLAEYSAVAGEERVVRVPGAGLAAGVYFVRIEGEAFSRTLPLTVMR